MFRGARILNWVPGAALLLAVIALPFLALAAPLYLPRNLARGDSGLDVYNLQVILNQDAETRVAAEGAGALGGETQFFGAATEDAVRRFQLKHAAEVLVPAGLEAPTGFVGARTRSALSARADAAFGGGARSAPPPAAAVSAGPPAVPAAEGALGGLEFGGDLALSLQNIFCGGLSDAPVLFPAEGQPVVAGGDGYLMGFRFNEGETYSLIDEGSGRTFAVAYAASSNTVTFTVPKSWTSKGYKMHVEDADGAASNTVTVYVSGASSPKITRISPSPMPFGEEVTIEGTNFTETGNSIVSSSGTVSDLGSERGKIKFVSTFGSQIPENIRAEGGGAAMVVLRVVNAKGASTPVMLNVSF